MRNVGWEGSESTYAIAQARISEGQCADFGQLAHALERESTDFVREVHEFRTSSSWKLDAELVMDFVGCATTAARYYAVDDVSVLKGSCDSG
jgi:hypothetical protein